MRPQDTELASKLSKGLSSFERDVIPLPGIKACSYRETLIEQMVESIRRIKYIKALKRRDLSPNSKDPNHRHFDPIRAAILFHGEGDLEERMKDPKRFGEWRARQTLAKLRELLQQH